jgi:glucose-6-phosphate 1-dehydrogenase
MRNAGSITVSDALKTRLESLDLAWANVRNIHADITHTNDESKQYKEAMEQLSAATRALWRLKHFWSDEP